jgi:ethanolamine utilization protein EutN
MILARVVGTVVATRKDERLDGRKLLVCRPVTPDGTPDGAHVVAADTVGAGVHEMVLLVSGSSARMAGGFKESPVDNAVVGIVDTVEMETALPQPNATADSKPTRAAAAPPLAKPTPNAKPASQRNGKRAAAAGNRGRR